jgi:hypothetical protein
MIGLARTAQLAGWGGGSAVRIQSTTTSSDQFDTTLLVRPSFVADYNGVTNSNAGSSLVAQDNDQLYDLTGVGTNSSKQIYAATFRVGTDWLTTGSTEGPFTLGFNIFYAFQNSEVNDFRNIFASRQQFDDDDVMIVFGNGRGGQISFTEQQFAPLRNRWLTFITATSDNPVEDFSGWNTAQAGPDFSNIGWGSYSMLIDTETAQVIAVNFGWNFNEQTTIDLTLPWAVNDFEADNNLNTFFWLDNAADLFNRTQVEIASHWCTFGDVLDPEVYWPNLTGTGVAGTVGGVQAWQVWDFVDAGTAIENDQDLIFAYSTGIGGDRTGSRLPNSATFDLNIFSGIGEATTVPEFKSLPT